ncbi:hypothetical protein ACFVY4_26560 [Streptomyces sp. NPDC058299]|uniref:hypothetical protein n=1 Tax=Streptomyces sp. NPDC058299 TaxID=3346435 RepID=UPI0036E9E037
MASPLGTHVPVDCPLCDSSVNIPVTETGRDGTLLTVTLDLGVLRQHVTTAHQRAGETS